MKFEFWKPFLLAASLLAVETFSASAQAQVAFTTLVSFGGANGSSPLDGLMEASDGNFYGTTYGGGTNGGGTVFRMTPDGSLSTLYDFAPDSTNGCCPISCLVQGPDGCLYGTTSEGGDVSAANTNGYGAVFKITTQGELTTLYSFTNGVDGTMPMAGLVLGRDGNFYGTTTGGLEGNTGSSSGTVFRVTTNGVFTALVQFPQQAIPLGITIGGIGISPDAALVQGSDGNFYGTGRTVRIGGPIQQGLDFLGTVFKLAISGTNFSLTDLFLFPDNSTNGVRPRCSLVQGSDGDFYGTTFGDNVEGGTVFRITANGTLTTLHSFSPDLPYSFSSDHLGAGLVRGTDGNFYGVAVNTDFNQFQIYQMTPAGGLTTLLSFTNTLNGLASALPRGQMIQGADGNFYGTTSEGGAYGEGMVFRLSVPLQPMFQSVVRTNGMISFTWNTVATNTYQLQYRTDLTQTNWSDLGNYTATNGTLSATDVIGTNSQRFYRVVLSP
jgi:uncharacterized repeat protein (TIGR03803 family)